MAAKRSTKSSAETLIWMLLAVGFLVVALYQPFRRAGSTAKAWGIFGIVGMVACVVWWIATIHEPPLALKIGAVLSVAAYGTGIVVRIVDGAEDTRVPTGEFNLEPGENVLYECAARIHGERRIRAFGGLGFRLARGIGAGGGLSVPVRVPTVVDEGSLLVTTRRVILAGRRETISLPRRALLDASGIGSILTLRPSRGAVVVADVDDAARAAAAVRSGVTS